MTKILIVDDESNIREVVKEYARVSGFECSEASDGLEAIKLVKENDFDCVILDIMMPELDGFSACRKIKELKDIPVIMLSARQEENDKLFCFEIGVDDYVTKPFSPKELMARIKAVTERRKNRQETSLEFEELKININARTVTIDGRKIMMTPKEMDLLIYLVQNKNIALSRENILQAVWRYDYYGDDRTVDTHIKMLRHSLEKYRDHVVTVRGMGYKFEI